MNYFKENFENREIIPTFFRNECMRVLYYLAYEKDLVEKLDENVFN